MVYCSSFVNSLIKKKKSTKQYKNHHICENVFGNRRFWVQCHALKARCRCRQFNEYQQTNSKHNLESYTEAGVNRGQTGPSQVKHNQQQSNNKQTVNNIWLGRVWHSIQHKHFAQKLGRMGLIQTLKIQFDSGEACQQDSNSEWRIVQLWPCCR